MSGGVQFDRNGAIATHGAGQLIGRDDAAAQATRILGKIEAIAVTARA
jgi:hypothetical protein